MLLDLCACAQENNYAVASLAFAFINLRTMPRGKKGSFYLHITMIISQSLPFFPRCRKAKHMPMTVARIQDWTIAVNIVKQTHNNSAVVIKTLNIQFLSLVFAKVEQF